MMNRGSAQQIGGSAGGGYDNTVAVKVHMKYIIKDENILVQKTRHTATLILLPFFT
jgi:hypothetical protein